MYVLSILIFLIFYNLKDALIATQLYKTEID